MTNEEIMREVYDVQCQSYLSMYNFKDEEALKNSSDVRERGLYYFLQLPKETDDGLLARALMYEMSQERISWSIAKDFLDLLGKGTKLYKVNSEIRDQVRSYYKGLIQCTNLEILKLTISR